MGMGGPAEDHRPRPDLPASPRSDLPVGARQENRETCPGMIMKSTVIVIPQKLMEVDVQEGIAGQNVPAEKIGVGR